jgi:Lecithin retinol acyltransferase
VRFSRGRPIWVRIGEFGWKSRPEIARRARSRLGENRYHILTNNCEHFCEWCVRGEHRSYQVDALLGLYGGAAQKLIGPLLRMIPGLNTGDLTGLASRS